jgi:hypothetical protein
MTERKAIGLARVRQNSFQRISSARPPYARTDQVTVLRLQPRATPGEIGQRMVSAALPVHRVRGARVWEGWGTLVARADLCKDDGVVLAHELLGQSARVGKDAHVRIQLGNPADDGSSSSRGPAPVELNFANLGAHTAARGFPTSEGVRKKLAPRSRISVAPSSTLATSAYWPTPVADGCGQSARGARTAYRVRV